MRYVAKVHILDIMDQVVVSGYVYDAEPLRSVDCEPFEFSWQVPGLGLDDPIEWLLTSFYRASQEALRPARESAGGAGV